MQKKLYFLDEQEKNRILNIHESATKKQYLLNEIAPLAIAAIAVGAVALGTYTYDYFANTVNSSSGNEFISRMAKGCQTREIQNFIKSEKSKPTGALQDADKTIMTILDNLGGKNDWISYDEASAIKNTLRKLPSIPQLCLVMDRYEETEGDSLLTRLKNQYYYESSFTTDIKNTLNSLVRKQQYINTEVEKTKTDTTTPSAEGEKAFEKFPCVLKSRKNPSEEGPFKSSNYDGKYYVEFIFSDGSKKTYYNTGVYYIKNEDKSVEPTGSDNFYRFTCKGNSINDTQTIVNLEGISDSDGMANVEPEVEVPDEITPTPDVKPVVKTGYIPIQGGGGFTTRNVRADIPELLQMAGLEGTTLTQDKINKLYDILSK